MSFFSGLANHKLLDDRAFRGYKRQFIFFQKQSIKTRTNWGKITQCFRKETITWLLWVKFANASYWHTVLHPIRHRLSIPYLAVYFQLCCTISYSKSCWVYLLSMAFWNQLSEMCHNLWSVYGELNSFIFIIESYLGGMNPLVWRNYSLVLLVL